VHSGPASTRVRSSTRTPARGRADVMTTKMTILRVCVGLLTISGCHKAYTPAGAPKPLAISGIYEMVETLYSDDCPPAVGRAQGIEARKKRIRVEVTSSAPSTGLLMMVDGVGFDGQVLPNGRFELKPVSFGRAGVSYKQSSNGRFTESGFSARYLVETSEVLPLARPGLPETRLCKYNFVWEARKL
jgi:hypothetical protein